LSLLELVSKVHNGAGFVGLTGKDQVWQESNRD
jgi:hypothetical protein